MSHRSARKGLLRSESFMKIRRSNAELGRRKPHGLQVTTDPALKTIPGVRPWLSASRAHATALRGEPARVLPGRRAAPARLRPRPRVRVPSGLQRPRPRRHRHTREPLRPSRSDPRPPRPRVALGTLRDGCTCPLVLRCPDRRGVVTLAATSGVCGRASWSFRSVSCRCLDGHSPFRV